MKAVIIAAGKGKRIRALSKDTPKPLVKLLGLALIERVILNLRQVGISDIIVVIGYKGVQIKRALGNGEKYGVSITYVRNKNYHLANGLSVLAAKDYVDKPFLLLMADHMVDVAILKKLIAEPIHQSETILCTDRFPPDYIDTNEATKVLINETGMIKDIGKNIPEYNGVDIGVFKCSLNIFTALQRSASEGAYALSDGIRKLIQCGKMRALDISGHFWIDVDTRKEYLVARKLILQQLKKPSDGPVARLLNRPLSLFMSRYLVNTPITPNMISIISFIFMLIAGGLFALGKLWTIILAGLVAQFASVLDGCDGEIARLKYLSSDFGGWFDAVLDRYGDAIVIIGIVWGYWTNTTDITIWLLGFGALVGSFMNSYTATKYDALFAKNDKRMKFRMGRDVRTFLIMVFALANELVYLLIVLAIITNLTVIVRIITVWIQTNKKEQQPTEKIEIISDVQAG